MSKPRNIWAWLSFVVAALCGAAALASGYGYQHEWWGLVDGLDMITWASYAALGAVFVALLVVIMPPYRGGVFTRVLGVVTLVIGIATLVPAWQEEQIPYVHKLPLAAARLADITSDVGNPPTFMDLVAVRGEVPQPPSYGGVDFARLQTQYYPDIQPVRIKMSPQEAFKKAQAVVESLGWQVISSVPDQGRIEAVATTKWFGLKDDVVVRVSYIDTGAKIDVRSKSRVLYNWTGDKGENARRVREFLRRVAA